MSFRDTQKLCPIWVALSPFLWPDFFSRCYFNLFVQFQAPHGNNVDKSGFEKYLAGDLAHVGPEQQESLFL